MDAIDEQIKDAPLSKEEARKQFIEVISIMFLVITVAGFFIFLFYLWYNRG